MLKIKRKIKEIKETMKMMNVLKEYHNLEPIVSIDKE